MPREVPTKAQLAKLPAWARNYVERLERERDQAVDLLFKFKDTENPTNVYVEDHVCIGEGTSGREASPEKRSGPTFVRHYLQTKRVNFRLPRSEMEMEVYVNEPEQRVEIRTPRGYSYIEPHGCNLFYLIPKEDMYLTPNATTLCQAAYEADKLSHDAFVRKFGFSQEALKEKMKSVVPESNWRRTVHG